MPIINICEPLESDHPFNQNITEIFELYLIQDCLNGYYSFEETTYILENPEHSKDETDEESQANTYAGNLFLKEKIVSKDAFPIKRKGDDNYISFIEITIYEVLSKMMQLNIIKNDYLTTSEFNEQYDGNDPYSIFHIIKKESTVKISSFSILNMLNGIANQKCTLQEGEKNVLDIAMHNVSINRDKVAIRSKLTKTNYYEAYNKSLRKAVNENYEHSNSHNIISSFSNL